MGWTRSLTRRSIYFCISLIFSLYIIFPGRLYGWIWILSAFTIFLVVLFFVELLSNRWIIKAEISFTAKLFWSSWIIRLAAMFILLTISYNTWGLFYSVGAKDEMVYYRIASESVVIWESSGLREAYQHILESYRNEYSDTGFATFLLIPMRIFNHSAIAVKIFLTFFGSLAVVRGYKLAKLLMNEPAARLAGIFLMLYPISWFYSGILLKESLMVLIVTEAILQIVKAQARFNVPTLVKILILIILVFFFRSAISILLIMVLGFTFVMQYQRKNFLLNFIFALLIISFYVFFLKSTGRFDEYYDLYTSVNEYTAQRISYMENINPFVAVVGSPVFAVLSYISPFPSLVTVPNPEGLPHTEYYYHVAGNIFWIVLSFFSFYGLYHGFRHRRNVMIVIIAFVVGYQFVLLKAMMFTSVRFSYPAKPFLLILAAYGIYELRNKKWYPFYLIAMIVMIIGWNYVRLRSRT